MPRTFYVSFLLLLTNGVFATTPARDTTQAKLSLVRNKYITSDSIPSLEGTNYYCNILPPDVEIVTTRYGRQEKTEKRKVQYTVEIKDYAKLTEVFDEVEKSSTQPIPWEANDGPAIEYWAFDPRPIGGGAPSPVAGEPHPIEAAEGRAPVLLYRYLESYNYADEKAEENSATSAVDALRELLDRNCD